MGNQQSFQQHTDFKDLATNYTYEKKYNDSRFGEVKLLKENSTGQQVFQKDFSSNTPKEFEDYVKQIVDSSATTHPNILRVYGYNSKKEDLFCSDFYKLSLFFESFESDLEQEITKRNHNQEYFNETELWYILDSVASACAYLQHNNVPHRDIRPFNILTTASKDYKVSAANIFRQSFNPAYFNNFDGLEARSRYYSPELLLYYSQPEGKRTAFDEYKNDVFALGMTLLEAGLLEKVENAYDFDKFEVRKSAIHDALGRLGQRYSQDFVKTVETALDFNPETRLDFVRLDRELSVYRKDIREQARGITSSSPLRTSEDKPVRSAPDQPIHPETPAFYDDELDFRVREAVKKSEEVIKRSSPKKYANKNLDPYIQAYLRNDLKPADHNILSQISPYLTSESKYTTTLTIEQPNYGRESQPINFNQTMNREELGDSFKRSGYVDLASSLQGHQPTNSQPVYREQPNQNYLTQNGLSASYGVAPPPQNYKNDADNLSRRIDERLRQSRQIYI